MIPVLFVHPRSNYKKIPGFDCYDAKRNALTYTGTSPVIAHPPCRLFSKLRRFSNAPDQERELAYWALKIVRKNGGILEHPASSQLWKDESLKFPKPGFYDDFGGFLFCIDQGWFGFYTQKKTLLYIVGIKMSDLPDYHFTPYLYSKKFPDLSPKQRSESTPEFIEFLRKIIEKITDHKAKKVDG